MHFTISVVSDTVCPWCYIGSRQLRRAISEYQTKHAIRNDTFTVSWHPFYLNPAQAGAPRKPSVDKREAFLKKNGDERAQELYERLSSAGEQVGIEFKFGGRTGSSRDSHRLIHLAGQRGGSQVQQRLVDLLFKAYFEEERDITDHDVLIDCTRKAGLDQTHVEMWLGSEDIGNLVDDEASKARDEGISGVPHFTINERFEIQGAQESLAFVRAFERLVVLEDRERTRAKAKV